MNVTVLNLIEINVLRVPQRCPCYEEGSVFVAKQRDGDVEAPALFRSGCLVSVIYLNMTRCFFVGRG